MYQMKEYMYFKFVNIFSVICFVGSMSKSRVIE